MIYKNNEIPEDFNKIAEINNNYIVWVKESKLNSGSDYNAYIQYLNPSFSYLYTENYRITNGDYYNYIANYDNNGVYSYITDYDLEYTKNTIQTDDITSNEFDRPDFPSIFICQVIMCIMFLWVFKQLSRLYFKGGLW